MPNHVKNVWRIKNIPPDKIQYIMNKLTTKLDRPEGFEDYIIDFDLIIPEPRFIQDCPKNCRVNKDSHVQEVEGRPWFDWYTWRCKYWGTKWGAYDGYTKIGKTQITFVFETAWAFPEPIAMKLIELGYDLDLRYADEDIGNNCGRMTYCADTGRWDTYVEDELSDRYRFANYLWNKY